MMGWLLAIAVATIAGAVYATAARRRRLGRIRAFGTPVDRERDAERVDRLRHARAGLEPGAYHDEQLWRDLDMDHVLARLDHNHSWVGVQCLRDRLSRRDHTAADLEALDREATYFAASETRRHWYASQLEGLGDWSANGLCLLFWGATPPMPWFRRLLQALALAMVVALILVPFQPAFFVVPIVLGLVNLTVTVALRERVEPWMPALRSLPAFLRVVQVLRGADDAALAVPLGVLRAQGAGVVGLRRLVRMARVSGEGQGVAAESIQAVASAAREFLNLFFLLDLNAFYALSGRLAALVTPCREVFLAVGRIDNALALASVRAGAPVWTRPVATPGRTLRVEGLVHPLLQAPVSASFVIGDRSWLVTGSNMSGKSTFLRSLGTGALMARALGMVFAARWEGAALRVMTSIGRADAVTEGRSYYLAEVERVQGMIEASAGEEPCLFLLDELYRGTNTTERVAASLAVLEHIDRPPHLVVVATHDLELLHWLGERYASWHFREEVHEGGLTFDYQLRQGVSSTRNAIALLDLMGYPATVVARAREVAGGTAGTPGAGTG